MSALREASSVILLRRTQPGFEVFMLRRQKQASFMASAFVFPGGAAEPDEDARTAAARELFEEAGVLLAKDVSQAETLEAMSLATLRKKLLAGADSNALLAGAGLAWSTESLVPWAHWITPSIEPKRFSARFFVCELPSGQTPRFDGDETVEEIWVRPADAVERAGELALPPPQVRTCWELARHETIAQVFAAGHARAAEPHPIMPRLRTMIAGELPCLLLPWDPEYTDNATGDAMPMTYRPAWATGPSRFVMENKAWKHVDAPGSRNAE